MNNVGFVVNLKSDACKCFGQLIFVSNELIANCLSYYVINMAPSPVALAEDAEKLFLGFDFSTQQLKGVIINDKREVLHQQIVQFDSDLPEFRTHNGVVKGDKNTVTAPVVMWVKALDIILEKFRVCGADFSKVCALSGSAQQHGTVYWASGAEETLKNLSDNHFLHSQLASSFSVTTSPVWMDSSTTKQCQMLEAAVGGPEELARITGSKAYERFSGSQIAKIAETKPTVYKNTERISLVSSFACSLFLGKYANIDYADGSGMNLLDIRTKQWSPELLEVTASDLADKLGTPVPSHTVLGKISRYFVERFGFNEQCDVVAFTGDNPSSLAGMCLTEGDMAVSLGTSDTLFMWLTEPKLLSQGHVLINPLSEKEYMGLLCYKNGSLCRERIKDSCANGSWDEFNKLLESTPRGNFGYMGMYYDLEEIVLPIQGEFKYDKESETVEKFPSHDIEIRALIEGQFLAKRALLEHDLDISIDNFSRIIATGGASQNQAILQVIADVFNAPVFTLGSSNSSDLGAAYRALDSYNRSITGDSSYKPFQLPSQLTLASSPYADSHEIYDPMVVRCRALTKKILEASVK